MSKRLNVLMISLVLLVTCGVLSSCGTKGPLYIPEQRYPQAAINRPDSAPLIARLLPIRYTLVNK